MLMTISGIIAGLCYLIASGLQLQTMRQGTDHRVRTRLLGGIAIGCHGAATYIGLIETPGYDLGLTPMLSVMALSITTIVLLSSLRRPIDNLFVVIYPFAMVTVLTYTFFGPETATRHDVTAGIFSHIMLSVVAYSLLTIAATQALLLSFGVNRLKQHELVILRNMPPLETMEHLMFEMIWGGLLFLTLSIVSGFVFLENLSGPGLMHHTVITMAAWLVFIVLLWGRYQLGWRGAIASRWTLTGFVLLALGYFGSKLVLEVILGRT